LWLSLSTPCLCIRSCSSFSMRECYALLLLLLLFA
jgi:hypothetical protein